VAQWFSCANFGSFCRISDSEGPDIPEGTHDPGANRLDRAGSAMCNGIFLLRLEGRGTPGDCSYIDNYLSGFDLSLCSVSILMSPSSTTIMPAPGAARVGPSCLASSYSSC